MKRWLNFDRNWLVWAYLAFLFVAMIILNSQTPLLSDDYSYSFNWATGRRCGTLGDIWKSQYVHYMTWGGRTVSHSIAQFFLMFNKCYFNIVNSLVYVAYGCLLYLHIAGWRKPRILLFIVINFMLLELTPAFGEDFLWLEGSCNYLWPAFIVFLFALPYRLQADKEANIMRNPICIVFYSALALIAGWTHEEVAPSVFCLILLFVGCQYYQKKRVYVWQIIGVLLFFCGMCLLFLSPGNFVRIESTNGPFGLMMKFYLVVSGMFTVHFLLFPLLLLVPCIVYRGKERNVLLLYVIVLAISALYVAVPPYFPDRAKLMMLSLTTIAVGIGVKEFFQPPKTLGLQKGLAIVMLVAQAMAFLEAYRATHGHSFYAMQVVEVVEAAKKAGRTSVEVPPYKSWSRFCASGDSSDLSSDSSFWTNKAFAQYYGLESVVVAER